MKHVSVANFEPVGLTIFLLPAIVPGEPVYLPCVFTRVGIRRALENPRAFEIGLSLLQETYTTPIELVRVRDNWFLAGHQCPPCMYETALSVAEEFRGTIECCLGIFCDIGVPDEKIRVLPRVA